nr:MAG TPA: hypothetical protein [Caudoviricetes sp.]
MIINKKPPTKATSHGTTRMTVVSITYNEVLRYFTIEHVF